GERDVDPEEVEERLARPTPERPFYIKHALKDGMEPERISELTGIDPWFIFNMGEIVKMERELAEVPELAELSAEMIREAKKFGFSDHQIATLVGCEDDEVRDKRKKLDITPVYKLVDTCAAEFEAYTPYYYSTYDLEDESRTGDKPTILIIGGGPNRIGQGLEFDYCCVHASLALREMGYDTIMVNSNPETVSTDYDISNRLYFEPLTYEDVLDIAEREDPEGIVVQLGGQTPLNLAVPLARAGVNILGTSPAAIDRAEDRKLFRELIQKLDLKQAPSDTATSFEQARRVAGDIGYPVLIRPSYVLGGRAMVVAWKEEELEEIVSEAMEAAPGHPVLIDKFLDDAIEVDVDAVCDGEDVVVAGVMEHIEEAGVHSGDSAMVLPPYSLDEKVVGEIKEQIRRMAIELEVEGLMNVQLAVKDGEIYVLEINPRGSRTVPFVSKATGLPLASVASKVIAGKSLKSQGVTADPVPNYYAVKESVMPFDRFPGVDPVLGPEMKSTGEVMGVDRDFAMAFAKSQTAAGQPLPTEGRVFVSVRDADKEKVIPIARTFHEEGFDLLATSGTQAALEEAGIPAERVPKLAEGRPNIVDFIKSRDVGLLINTPSGPIPRRDEVKIRGEAVRHNIPLITTTAAADASARAISALKADELSVHSLQEIHRETQQLPENVAPESLEEVRD
ncbi:MAG: carbamoyl-phosphate synthase large subunit, partial [Planctomycetota bacterium]